MKRIIKSNLVRGDTNEKYAVGYRFVCPACKINHMVTCERLDSGPNWSFSGTLERPTIQPSILVRMPGGDSLADLVCHSFVRDGKIEFLSDCTHDLAGKTVDLDDIQDGED